MLTIRHIAGTAVLLAMVASAAYAADNNKETSLINTLQTGSKPEKAIACKNLAIYGTKAAVPSLAALLPDPELSSWARIALENITDPAADQALRDAIGKVEGKLLIGVINSTAQRRSAVAVDALIPKLKDNDPDVASAAAEALGHIATKPAADALEQFLPNSPAAVRPSAAYGLVLCAEQCLADKNRAEAIRLYDFVRKSDVPRQRIQEATRGAILARGAEGIPLLLEQLRSPNLAMFAIGVRTAREMQGPQVAEALIAELPSANPDRRSLLIITLADRGDSNALPAVLAATKSGPTSVRIVAAGALERLGNASCVPTLLDAAIDPEPALATAAKTTLARLKGKEIDAAILDTLSKSSGKTLAVLIDLAERRKIEGALAAIAKCVENPDPAVRSTAIESLGAIGEQQTVADLVRLLPKFQEAKDRADLEKALVAICSRWGAVCTPSLLPLAKSNDAALRATASRTLACCGGPDALAAVSGLVADADETVQDAAVRTLSTWPNRWPDDASVTQPLLTLAKSGKKPQHQVLALRAYLQFVQGTKRLSADQRLASINAALPLISRPEEKRMAVSALASIATAGSLQPLVTLTDDDAVSAEACSAIVDLAAKHKELPKDQLQKALQAVVDKSKSDATKKKAQDLLQSIK